MPRLNADTINRIAEEISKEETFDMVYITKIRVWFKLNERNVWEVSDEKEVRELVSKAVKERFNRVIAEQYASGELDSAASGASMARVQEVLDLYKPAPLKKITIAMKRYAKDDGEILRKPVNVKEVEEVSEETTENNEYTNQ